MAYCIQPFSKTSRHAQPIATGKPGYPSPGAHPKTAKPVRGDGRTRGRSPLKLSYSTFRGIRHDAPCGSSPAAEPRVFRGFYLNGREFRAPSGSQ